MVDIFKILILWFATIFLSAHQDLSLWFSFQRASLGCVVNNLSLKSLNRQIVCCLQLQDRAM